MIHDQAAGGGSNGGQGQSATAGGGRGLQHHHEHQQPAAMAVVPPGFRFHPTDEELLYYYLRKKVAYQVIDLDVIRDVDLNRLEPWDLKDKCRIGSGPQNEWYFFSHKDKKYPTGTRTNRATNAGFWKATGRDKAIHHLNNSKPIGMRKTLVFYTGRAPHGQKTDWIMHEYRLIDDNHNSSASSSLNDKDDHYDHGHHQVQQEEGWVVCRVFKKKTHQRGFQSELGADADDDHQQAHSHYKNHMININGPPTAGVGGTPVHSYHQYQMMSAEPKSNNHNFHHPYQDFSTTTLLDGSMNLPQLLSQESSSAVSVPPTTFLHQPAVSLNNLDIECSQNLMKLTAQSGIVAGATVTTGLTNTIPNHHHHHHTRQQEEDHGNNNGGRYTGNSNSDWSFLDKLLSSSSSSTNHYHHSVDQLNLSQTANSFQMKFPFHQYLGVGETDVIKFSK
ncbi:hypothetical protein C5167_011331 [Papaver somniferum]|uniref:NAC domain-containing protein n=1 Tax=Papaver somniferum TaxID=3469 RepID=A0A4Y7K2S6_PAPSO|nr:NAC domain-containing protein 76-like [Papaver somniferum]RZC67644.1 hypothetical protein C5167_011331 [Papaver somniferum]